MSQGWWFVENGNVLGVQGRCCESGEEGRQGHSVVRKYRVWGQRQQEGCLCWAGCRAAGV